MTISPENCRSNIYTNFKLFKHKQHRRKSNHIDLLCSEQIRREFSRSARSHYLCNQTEFSARMWRGSLLVTTCETYQPSPSLTRNSGLCGRPFVREPSNCELIDTRWKTAYSNRRQIEIGLDFVHVVLRCMLFCYYICIRFSLKSLVSIYSFQVWGQ